jgi:hypothetical protein
MAGDVTLSVAQSMDAINNGQHPSSVAAAVAKDLLVNHFQAARIVAQAYDKFAQNGQAVDEKNDVRNYYKFKDLVEGETKGFFGNKENNSYLNIIQSDFKSEPDLHKALEMIPDIVSYATNRARNNPQKLWGILDGLKSDSNATLPGMSDQIAREQYINFLKATQGAEKTLEFEKRVTGQQQLHEQKNKLLDEALNRMVTSGYLPPKPKIKNQ